MKTHVPKLEQQPVLNNIMIANQEQQKRGQQLEQHVSNGQKFGEKNYSLPIRRNI